MIRRQYLDATRRIGLALAIGLLIVAMMNHFAHAEPTYSQLISKGKAAEVSTITGNGTAGQGAYTLDHPRFPGVDTKGNVYFLDGSQKNKKLRMWDGNTNVTLLDMKKSKVVSREGDFYATGLQIISDYVYFSSEEKVYKYDEGRATELDENISKYMRDHHYAYIFRMEQLHGDLVFMFYKKGDYTSYYEYGFASYNLSNHEMTEISPPFQYANPSNFFIQDKGIDVADLSGAIYYEKFFPKQYYNHLDTNMGEILDVWVDEDESVCYAIHQDKVYYKIYCIKGDVNNLGQFVVGGAAGFTDGVADEVRMDYPTDFVWDGNGYLFADQNNNAIRKLWIDKKPLSMVN